MQESRSELLDRWWHGRRKEYRLALLGKLPHDFLHVGHESHVEHAIGLIENKELEFGQRAVALIDQIKQSAGGGDD